MKRVYCRHNWSDQITKIERGLFWRIISVDFYRECKTCGRQWASWCSEPTRDTIGFIEDDK